MKLFTLGFWKNALEAALVGGFAGFTAALPTTLPSITLNELKAAGIGFATGAIYAFIKQLGAVQSANAAVTGPKPLGGPTT